ncbi:MAG: hypothetical protein VX988_01065 [Planctomycetota bacterium]|nr:hypothetical protein [Planctomycetota bacterium]
MNALANPEVGKFLNKNFVSAFQRVGTFKIVNGQKQGGNVASYFCAQDGRVLHVVAGPVNAQTLLKEAKWVVETARSALAESKKNGKSFKGQFRVAHAERLRQEHGFSIEPVTFDTPAAAEGGALSYRDPSGKPLAPILQLPVIEDLDVSFDTGQRAAFEARQKVARQKASAAELVVCRRGKRWVLGNQGRVHMLMAAHSMKKIESMYASIFQGILGEQVSTKPVEIVTPFPWVRR